MTTHSSSSLHSSISNGSSEIIPQAVSTQTISSPNFSSQPASQSLMTARKVWEASVSSLQNELDPQVFGAYIKPLSLRSVDVESSEVVITAPNRFLCDHVEAIYKDRLSSMLSSNLGVDGIKIRFKVEPSQNGASQLLTASNAGVPNVGVPNIVVKKMMLQPAPAVQSQQTEKPKDLSQLNANNVNARYTFANFVVGSSNQFCHAAARQVAEQPGKAYNPLFIYGGVGLGKTHLLHAIGNSILQSKPDAKVLYLSAETFMNELIQSLRRGKMDEFKAKIRNIECLLIDDIQFICGKERTQEEFFHTFNALYNAKHQIVITSDKIPQDISSLEDRLKTRFAWGLIADIQSPDFETRVAILNRKAAVENFFLPSSVAQFIAEKISSNIRELEGALTRLHAVSSLQNSPITVDLAEVVLRPMLQPKSVNISVDDIKRAVVNYFGLKVSDLSSKRRTRNLSFPRHIAMFLCRKHTTASYPEIGANFGGRDHSSVIHAANVVARKIAADAETRMIVEKIEGAVRG